MNFSHRTLHLLQKTCRNASTKVNLKTQNRIKAWQVHSYGGIEELQSGAIRVPKVVEPDQVLVNVEAASVNPIDLLMMGGYGRTLIQIPRQCEMELPLTLGRDFCGTILYKGPQVREALQIGDRVYGFMPLHKQGSFSEVVVAHEGHICHKPPNLSPTESTSLVYATMTAWSALYLFGNLTTKSSKGAKVLILGASGGVGTAAVQLLKSQEAIVYGACSSDAVPLVTSLGADYVFDYRDPDYLKKVEEEGYYHIILDCAKFGIDNVPKSWHFGTFISLNSPLLLNTDKDGLVPGVLNSAATFLQYNIKFLNERKKLMWAFFVPSSCGFQFIDKLIKDGKIKPLIHKEFGLENLPDAFCELKNGHLRGKIVIKY